MKEILLFVVSAFISHGLNAAAAHEEVRVTILHPGEPDREVPIGCEFPLDAEMLKEGATVPLPEGREPSFRERAANQPLAAPKSDWPLLGPLTRASVRKLRNGESGFMMLVHSVSPGNPKALREAAEELEIDPSTIWSGGEILDTVTFLQCHFHALRKKPTLSCSLVSNRLTKTYGTVSYIFGVPEGHVCGCLGDDAMSPAHYGEHPSTRFWAYLRNLRKSSRSLGSLVLFPYPERTTLERDEFSPFYNEVLIAPGVRNAGVRSEISLLGLFVNHQGVPAGTDGKHKLHDESERWVNAATQFGEELGVPVFLNRQTPKIPTDPTLEEFTAILGIKDTPEEIRWAYTVFSGRIVMESIVDEDETRIRELLGERYAEAFISGKVGELYSVPLTPGVVAEFLPDFVAAMTAGDDEDAGVGGGADAGAAAAAPGDGAARASASASASDTAH